MLESSEILERVRVGAQRPAQVALTPPKLYLNGFPKAGLHLARQMALGLLEPVRAEHNWYGTNAWETERYNLEHAGVSFGAIRPGQFLKGHSGYLYALEALLVGLGIGMILIVRDLRDVVVSQTYHILNASEEREGKLYHPGKAQYMALGGKEEIMLAVIEGIEGYPGVFERFATFAPWLDKDWALQMRFEDMVLKREREAARLFDYCYTLSLGESGLDEVYIDKEARRLAIASILYEMSQSNNSPTFRKGKTKQWKREFTPRVRECFKEHDPGYLVQLGYEADTEWR